MQTWEYFVAPLLEHNPGEILNSFGEDGWELVAVLQIENPQGGRSLVAYLRYRILQDGRVQLSRGKPKP